MKLILSILIALVFALPIQAASVRVDVHDVISSVPINNRRVTVTLVQPGPVALGNWVFVGDNKSQFTDSTGVTTFTNMLTLGSYRLDVAGAPSRSYIFCISSTNGTWNVTQLFGDCTTNNIVQYYTADQIDALLAGIDLDLSLTNVLALGLVSNNNGYATNLHLANQLFGDNVIARFDILLANTVATTNLVLSLTTNGLGYFASSGRLQSTGGGTNGDLVVMIDGFPVLTNSISFDNVALTEPIDLQSGGTGSQLTTPATNAVLVFDSVRGSNVLATLENLSYTNGVLTGGAGGGTTNGIINLNGVGTNTLLIDASLQGTNFYTVAGAGSAGYFVTDGTGTNQVAVFGTSARLGNTHPNGILDLLSGNNISVRIDSNSAVSFLGTGSNWMAGSLKMNGALIVSNGNLSMSNNAILNGQSINTWDDVTNFFTQIGGGGSGAATNAVNGIQTNGVALISVGATNISFIPTTSRTLTGGVSGATAIIGIPKPPFSPVANVKDYGAVGDGASDDRAAFQLAFNTGYKVYVPASIYKIGGTLYVTNQGFQIFGDGQKTNAAGATASHLVFTNTGTHGIIASNSDFTGLEFRDLMLQGPGGQYTTNIGLFCNGNIGGAGESDGCLFSGLSIYGWGEGWRGEIIGASSIDRCNFYYNSICLVSTGQVSTLKIVNTTLNNSAVLANCYGANVEFDSCLLGILNGSGNGVNYFSDYPIRLFQNSVCATFKNNHLEYWVDPTNRVIACIRTDGAMLTMQDNDLRDFINNGTPPGCGAFAIQIGDTACRLVNNNIDIMTNNWNGKVLDSGFNYQTSFTIDSPQRKPFRVLHGSRTYLANQFPSYPSGVPSGAAGDPPAESGFMFQERRSTQDDSLKIYATRASSGVIVRTNLYNLLTWHHDMDSGTNYARYLWLTNGLFLQGASATTRLKDDVGLSVRNLADSAYADIYGSDLFAQDSFVLADANNSVRISSDRVGLGRVGVLTFSSALDGGGAKIGGVSHHTGDGVEINNGTQGTLTNLHASKINTSSNSLSSAGLILGNDTLLKNDNGLGVRNTNNSAYADIYADDILAHQFVVLDGNSSVRVTTNLVSLANVGVLTFSSLTDAGGPKIGGVAQNANGVEINNGTRLTLTNLTVRGLFASNSITLGANQIDSWDDVTNYFTQTGSGGASPTFNNNQFASLGGSTNIASGALLTNITIKGTTTLPAGDVLQFTTTAQQVVADGFVVLNSAGTVETWNFKNASTTTKNTNTVMSIGDLTTSQFQFTSQYGQGVSIKNAGITTNLISTNNSTRGQVLANVGGGSVGWTNAGGGGTVSNAAALTYGQVVVGQGDGGIATTNEVFIDTNHVGDLIVSNGITVGTSIIVYDGSGTNTITGSEMSIVSTNSGGLGLLSVGSSLAVTNVLQVDTTAANKSLVVSTNGTTYGTFNGTFTGTFPKKTNAIYSITLANGTTTLPTGSFNIAPPHSADAYTISGWAISAMGTSPTCTIDIWKIADGNALPTVANTIMSTKFQLTGGNATNSNVTTFFSSLAVAKGDMWGGSIDAVSGATNITIQIMGYR